MTALIEMLNHASTAWWNFVVHSSWQSALVAGALMGIVTWGRRWPAPWRYGLLVLALLKFASPPLFSLPTGIFSQAGPRAAAQTPVLAQVSPPVFPAQGAMNIRAGAMASGELPEGIRFTEHRESAAAGAAMPGQPRTAPMPWKTGLLLLHFLGSLVVLAWIGVRWVHLRNLVGQARLIDGTPLAHLLTVLSRELGLKRVPRCGLSEQVSSPIAFGILHPSILLPATVLERLSESEMRTILLHELAHIRRRDLWLNWLQLALQTVWWFHPMLWLLNRTIRKTREDCCDDLLLSRGLTSNEAYCDTLLRAAVEFASPMSATGALGFAEQLHPMGRRLARISDRALPRVGRVSVAGLVLLVLLGCVLLPGLRSQTAPAKSVGGLFDELSPDMIHESRRQERLLQQFLDQRGDALTFLANELKHVTHPESSTNVDRRVKATRLLKEFNPPAPEAVPVLVKALEDQSDVRRYAAYSLSDMGPLAKEAVPALIKALRSTNSGAGMALAKIAPESDEVAQALLDVFADSNQPEDMSEQLTFALPWLTTRKLEIELALLQALNSSKSTPRNNVVMALVQLPPQTAQGKAVMREDLVQRRSERQSPKTASKERIQYLIEKVKPPSLQMEAYYAIKELFALGTNAQAAVPALIEFLQNPRNKYRVDAVSALGKIGLGAKDAVPALMAALDDDDLGVQGNALIALGKIGESARLAIPVLSKLLDDPKSWTRFYAAYGMCRMDREQYRYALPVLLKMLNRKPGEGPSNWMLIEAFGEIGPAAAETVPHLTSLLADQDQRVRFKASKALWRIDPRLTDRIVPVLITLIEDPLFVLDLPEAISLLGDIGTPAKPARPALQRLLKDEDEGIRAAATEAIRKLY